MYILQTMVTRGCRGVVPTEDEGSAGGSQAPAQQAQAPTHEAVFGGVPMMERFRRMTPPFFKGESDPILAESWLQETEKILRAIRSVPMCGGPQYYTQFAN
ncbi:hypothetical protein Taro_000124 [Colocasia esculenta]|uniref:Uncharacterized protein n=1 Tax=Colocasia esculenta TaxID=4460 RepID=A0A843TE89_COLES|nr:hypothetical protein [Colocasia esculenta]